MFSPPAIMNILSILSLAEEPPSKGEFAIFESVVKSSVAWSTSRGRFDAQRLQNHESPSGTWVSPRHVV